MATTIFDWTVSELSPQVTPPIVFGPNNALTMDVSPALLDGAPIVYEFFDNKPGFSFDNPDLSNDLRFNLRLNLLNSTSNTYTDFIVDVVTIPPFANNPDVIPHPGKAHFHPSTNNPDPTRFQAYAFSDSSGFATQLPSDEFYLGHRLHLQNSILAPDRSFTFDSSRIHHWNGFFALVITPIKDADDPRLAGLNAPPSTITHQFSYNSVVNQHFSPDVTGTGTNDLLVGVNGVSNIVGDFGDDTALGGDGNDNINGAQGSDYLYGQTDNDVLRGGADKDWLDGGADIDTAVYSGSRSDYSVQVMVDGSVRISDTRAGAPDDIDSVQNVEFFEFAGGVVLSFDELVASPLSRIPVNAKVAVGGDDVMSGDASGIVQDAFFFDTALVPSLGKDRLVDFGVNDFIVTTSLLFDSNHDGIVTFGRNGKLDLAGATGNSPVNPNDNSSTGQVELRDISGQEITKLHYDGTLQHNGVDYFVYSQLGSGVTTGDLLFA